MTTAIIILSASIFCFFLGAYWYFIKFEKRKATGLTDYNNQPLYEGDTITYSYWDKSEPTGIGKVVGKIVFENAAFVVKEPSFYKYNWNRDSTRPQLLYDWLNDNKCSKVSSIQHPRLNDAVGQAATSIQH